MSTDDLSRVRNAARDMANAYIAFEKAAARMVEASGRLGGAQRDVVKAVQEGCDTPARAKAFNAIYTRLAIGK